MRTVHLLSVMLFVVTACSIDLRTSSTEGAATESPDAELAPPPVEVPPGLMQAGQTCIDGSLLPGERCAPGLRCVRDNPNLPIGLCVRVVNGAPGAL